MGYAPVEVKNEWISAAKALALLKGSSLGEFSSKRTIANRAADGLMRSRAQRFIRENPGCPRIRGARQRRIATAILVGSRAPCDAQPKLGYRRL